MIYILIQFHGENNLKFQQYKIFGLITLIMKLNSIHSMKEYKYDL